MRRCQRCFLAALAAAATLSVSAPAGGFELFGVRLWGEPEPDAASDVIDPLPYAVTFVVEGSDDDLAGALQGASGLWGDRERPASGRAGLLARAKGDYRRILAALYQNAYYGGEISIQLNGREASDLTLDSPLSAPVEVALRVRPGPRFRFGEARIVNPPPEDVLEDDEVEDAQAEDFRSGARANAAAVSAASDTAIARWRQVGYAKASEAGREVIADHATSRLDAVITLDPGRAARFGEVRVAGRSRIDPGFAAYMADLPRGRSFDPDRIRAAEEQLSRLDVFRSVRIEEAEAIRADGLLDMTILLEDRARRTLGFGATASTLEGLGVEAFWLHRNLFGRAERLRFDASVTGLGLSADDLDYSAGVSFLRPGVINNSTSLIAALTARRLDLDNYREQSITGRVGLQRSFARNLNGEISFAVSRARFEDVFGTRDFLLAIPTARGDYDRRDDPLDPTRGYFLGAEVTPFYEAEFGNFATRGTLEGRIYRGFGPEARVVLAARARVGSYVGPPDDESPPNQLFFAGGAGSIRGYAYRSVGVETERSDDDDAVGGRSLAEASGELRFRVRERFGGVGFVDAGFVGEDSAFGGGELRIGAGAGLRYFTGFGPLRIDVATPINPRDEDSLVSFYVGIGQAF